MNTKTCTTCEGSGKVRETTYTVDKADSTYIILTCKVCKGLGQVPKGNVLNLPKVEVRGTINVINPGDVGYEEAKQRLLNKQKVG